MENLYLISGEDEFTKNEYLDSIKAKFGRLDKGVNFLTFDKDNIMLLDEELSTYSFFTGKRLIVVKVPKNTRKNAENDEEETNVVWYDEELEKHILDSLDLNTIVFVEEGTSKGKLYKFVNSNGVIVLCDKQKPLQLQRWITEKCKDNGVAILSQDSVYLAQVCGNNKQRINNELEKLLLYIDNKAITRQDIDLICTKTPETIIFNLTDGIGQKRPEYSLRMLDELIEQKEPIQKILVMITRHFKSLLLVKLCMNNGENVEKRLGLKQFPAMKYREQSSNFSLDELVNIFKKLARLDIQSKTTSIDLKVGIQKIIME